MDISILLYANNRNKTDFSDEPLLWRKSAQLTVYCRYLFKEIGFAPFYRKIIKEIGNPLYRRITKMESKSFSWILEYSLMAIIVPKQIFLMSLYFGGKLPN